MNKIKYKNKFFIALLTIGLLWAGSVLAGVDDLQIDFQDTPLFNEANFLPGNSVVRWVKVNNNTGESQSIYVEAINFSGFPKYENVPLEDLSRVLNIVIRKKGGNDLYGGSVGNKTLFDFYKDGEIYLSDVSSNSYQEYDFEINFISSAGDEWQGRTTGFDILIGFQGAENGGGGGITYGSGGNSIRGLTIVEPVTIIPTATSVTIDWTTNYFSTSWIIYAKDGDIYTFDLSQPNYGYPYSSVEDFTKVTGHSVTINGLEPGITYYFRCVSHASLAVSTEYDFTTLSEEINAEIPENIEQELVQQNNYASKESNDNKFIYNPDQTSDYAEESQVVTVQEDNESGLNRFLAAIGGLLSLENICWLLLALIIVIIVLFIFSEKKDDLEKEKKRKLYFLSALIILMIIYYLLCPTCLFCWIIIFVLLAIAIISLFFRKSN